MQDTIAAIATSLGVGAISIIRLSGKNAIEITNKMFKGKNLLNVPSHTINYGYIVDNDEIIDEVLVSVMKAPRTFTREDVIEINCHGGIATTSKVLELALRNGARLAEGGEFTKRAFINGRINLMEAEAVKELIDAKTDYERSNSIKHLSGRLTVIIKKFRQNLLELLANIEVNIDYPEYEDIEVVTLEQIRRNVNLMRESLEKIVVESENGQLLQNGINTVILGRPNVGKSSILNALLGEDKAIVTDIAGTTRDTVEGNFVLNGVLFHFIDTAGIRETEDIIEKVGVEKSKKALDTADFILMVLNGNEKLSKEDYELLELIKNKNYLVVINKSDLELKIDTTIFDNVVFTNTVSVDGIESLKEKMIRMFKLDKISQNDQVFLANTRQISLAKEALDMLKDVEIGLENEEYVDMIEIDIKRIWEKLGELLGESYSDELLDQLFSQFCLGK